MNELVSVIMTVYNEKSEWIWDSIQSIMDQTYNNIEFIIICDTTDIKVINTLKGIKRKYPTILIEYNEFNMGLVKSLNKGIKIANGTYIARMDADDISLPHRIEIELKYLKSLNCDLVFSEVNMMNEQGSIQETIPKRDIESDKLTKIFKYGNVSKHPTWLGKTIVFQKMNGYRDIKYCEDLEFILRAIQNNYLLFKIGVPLLNYRFRDNSISRKNALEQYLIAEKLRKLYVKGLLTKFSEKELNNLDITKEQKDSFRKANLLFLEGINILKSEKNIIGLYKILKAFSENKVLRKRIIEIMKFKIVEKWS